MHMFGAIQIPLADLRFFVSETTGRLTLPSWPLADPTRHFVRGTGPVRRRKRGGAAEWIGESLYCDARHAVVFPAGPGQAKEEAGSGLNLTPLFRRFLATGRSSWPGAVARMDIGFKVRGRTDTGRITTQILPSPRHAAHAIAMAQIMVPPRNQARSALTSGPALAAKVLHETTSTSQPLAERQLWWVQAGCPLILIEAPFERRYLTALEPALEVGKAAQRSHEAVALHHFSYIESGRYRIPVWTLFYGRDIPPEKLRLLRIHLWRIHSEREVLRLVLAECIQHRLDPSNPALRDYLARQSSTLRQATKEGFPQASLLSHAYSLDSLVNTGEIAELREILHDVSPGLASSVMPLVHMTEESPPKPIYIVTVHGDLQVADTIDNTGVQRIDRPGQLGAVISGQASVSGGTFQGSSTKVMQVLQTVDLTELARELQSLAIELERRMVTPEQHADVKMVREAGERAIKGDRSWVARYLERVGKWVLNVGTEVGTDLAVAVIKAAIGI